jgi:hypothetical protein
MRNMRPINDDLVLSELDRRTFGYGNGERTAKRLGVDSSHLREIKSGRRPPSRRVAEGLGFELKWVKKETRR